MNGGADAGADRLAALQAALCAAVANLDDAACRARWLPELSPVGWHLPLQHSERKEKSEKVWEEKGEVVRHLLLVQVIHMVYQSRQT